MEDSHTHTLARKSRGTAIALVRCHSMGSVDVNSGIFESVDVRNDGFISLIVSITPKHAVCEIQ